METNGNRQKDKINLDIEVLHSACLSLAHKIHASNQLVFLNNLFPSRCLLSVQFCQILTASITKFSKIPSQIAHPTKRSCQILTAFRSYNHCPRIPMFTCVSHCDTKYTCPLFTLAAKHPLSHSLMTPLTST